MEPTSLTINCVGYELTVGYQWTGIYEVWSLEDFAQIDLSTKSSALSLSLVE